MINFNSINNKIPCSVTILTRNSEKFINQVLEGLKGFREIIILDGNSTDNTRKICQKFNNCKIFSQTETKEENYQIKDFSKMKNKALRLTSYDWILDWDSDEIMTEESFLEIKEIINNKNPSFFIYQIPRKYSLKGQIIDCAITYPNYQIRLWHKKTNAYYVKTVHEKVIFDPCFDLGRLKNYMILELDELKILKDKWNYYLALEKDRHKNITWWQYFKIAFKRIEVAFLYLLRHIKILLFCKGKRMPFKIEILKQWYNIKSALIIFPYDRKKRKLNSGKIDQRKKEY